MNIKDFEDFFSSTLAERGREYAQSGKVLSIDRNGDSYYSKVSGSDGEEYEVSFSMEDNGEILNLYCDCPFAEDGAYCKHEYAVLMMVKDKLAEEETASRRILPFGISSLIKTYSQSQREALHITPSLRYYGNIFYMSLHFGTSNIEYRVHSISELCHAFRRNLHKDYGKHLSVVHSYNALDDKSRELLAIAEQALSASHGTSPYEVILSPHLFEHFLSLYEDDCIAINGARYTVEDKNPPVTVRLSHTDDCAAVDIACGCVFAGSAAHAYYIDNTEKIIYRAALDFHYAVSPLLDYKNQMPEARKVSDTDLAAFLFTVIDKVESYATVTRSDDFPDITVPRLRAELYVDAPGKTQLCANLFFVYGDKKYPSCYDTSENPFYDERETAVCDRVAEYFDYCEDDEGYRYEMKSSSRIYDFLSEGAKELSETADVYLTDRLKSVRLRMPPTPKVRFEKDGDVLQLDIDAGEYTLYELSDMLKAYAKGERYFLFTDGSIAPIYSLDSLDEMMRALDLQDIDTLRANIKLPLYRMFYLDKLRQKQQEECESHGERFRALSEEKSLSELRDTFSCDGKLWDIMRSYQREGYSWMSMLAGYGFGGILADDMGLGKTLQSIALIDAVTRESGGTALVVCPASLVLNWQSELEKFAPHLKAACITGNIAVRNEYIRRIDEYDVAVTSYSALTRDIDRYEKTTFALCIADEAQAIKNQSAIVTRTLKAVTSRLRFALTGTPVENSLSELWSIFDYVMPGYLHEYTYFRENFEYPIVHDDEKATESLQMMISPFILRRMKADVLTELPEKTIIPTYSEMEKDQRGLYAACVEEARRAISQTHDKITIFATLTRLRQICCDPHLAFDTYTGESAKLTQCIDLVQSCVDAGHKILIFSQFTKMLDRIAEKLSETKVTYYTLTGDTQLSERMRLVTAFNTDSTNVFLISLRAGGTGLNLTGADIVIHYDPWWNVSLENQASDRAYRMGQKRNVQVFKLIAKSTLEERIQQMQMQKAHLTDIAVGGNFNIGDMSAEEILGLLD